MVDLPQVLLILVEAAEVVREMEVQHQAEQLVVEETDHKLHGFQVLYLPYSVIHQVLLCTMLVVEAVVIALVVVVLVELEEVVMDEETKLDSWLMKVNMPQVVAVEEQRVDLLSSLVLLNMPLLVEVWEVLVDQV